MTAIITALFTSGALKWIGAAIVALVGLVGAWLHGRSAGKAQAADQVKTAQLQTQVAQMDTADAVADKKQAQAQAAAVKVAAQAQSDAQALPDSDLDAQLAKLGVLRKD